MSKPDAWMPLFIGDYLGDTTRFNATQHGAYLLLIMDYWRNGPPPDDDDVLATAARCKPAEWKRIRASIADKFVIADGVWRHKRIDEELGDATERSSKAEEKARRGASAKWGGNETAERGRELRSSRMTEARAKGTHTPEQWEAMKAWHNETCVRCGATGLEIVRDHIVPVYQGGSDGIENIQPLCRHCNAAKGPERADLRRDGWREACKVASGVASLAGNKCLPDACPSPSPLPPSGNQHPPLPPQGGTRGSEPRGKGAIVFATFVGLCKTAGEKPIPESDPVWEFAEKAGISELLLRVHWKAFSDRYRDSAKRYTDWRKVFRNSVKGNWFGVWRVEGNGTVTLSSKGQLYQRGLSGRAPATAAQH